MKFSKTGRAKYISHLDLMHTMQRSISRAEIPVWFTEGFNQHAYISIAMPLSTGFSGECEFMDFNMMADSVPEDAVQRINEAFPEGLSAQEIYPLENGGRPVRDIAYSLYVITLDFDEGVPEEFLRDANLLFDKDEILILKRSKSGETEVNMKEFIREISFESQENAVKIFVLTAAGNTNLSPQYITKALEKYCPQHKIDGAAYHRLKVYDKELCEFR